MTVTDAGTVFALLRNESSDVVSGTTADRLLEVALDADGRALLLSMVNRPGLRNAARRAIVDALKETFEPHDAALLARAVVRQHVSVILPAIDLLERSRSAAALFAVRKPLRRGEREVDEACDRAAARLAAEVAAEHFIRRDGVPGADFSERELAYAAAASAPETLAAIHDGGADRSFSERLGKGISALLSELGEQGHATEFDIRLRNELHEAVLLTGAPVDPAQQDRSLENLFRRRDLADVRELLAHLPNSVIVSYARRALSRSNRRSERVDRAVLALAALERHGPQASEPLHDVLLECLEEENDDLAAGAVAALAPRAGDMKSAERQRIIKRFGQLPLDGQQALAPRLSGLAATAEEDLDADSFLRWVDAAPDDERVDRLLALKTRWDTTVVTPEQAPAFMTIFARGVQRLPETDHDRWREELLEGALSWLYRQGTQMVVPSRALLSWPGFASLVVDDLDLALSLLRADQARTLLAEALKAAPHPGAFVEALVHSDVGPDEVRRVIVPVLGEGLRSDIHTVGAVFEGATVGGRRRLLCSALVAAGQTKRRIDALGETTEDAAGAAVAEHGAAVLAALDDAEAASEGNDVIRGHFASVRRAVNTVLASDDPDHVPDGVRAWRRDAATRFPEAVEVINDGRTPLSFRAGAPAAVVLRILAELDQRVHSSRVAAVEERSHLRHDLMDCIDEVVDRDLAAGDATVALSSRPSIGQLVWSRWAARLEDPEAALVDVLESSLEARARQQALLQVDALAGRTQEDDIERVVDALDADATVRAWALTTAGLANRLRELGRIEQDAKSRGVDAMERVAERLDAPLRAVEGLMVGYFRLRGRLGTAGWRAVEEPLGRELRRDQIDPSRHEVDGRPNADRYVVTSMGVRVRGRVVRRAVVEPLSAEVDPVA